MNVESLWLLVVSAFTNDYMAEDCHRVVKLCRSWANIAELSNLLFDTCSKRCIRAWLTSRECFSKYVLYSPLKVIAHCNKNPVYLFPEKEFRGITPNFHIHVSVSNLYIHRIGPHISCSRIGRPIVQEYINRSQTHECGHWD